MILAMFIAFVIVVIIIGAIFGLCGVDVSSIRDSFLTLASSSSSSGETAKAMNSITSLSTRMILGIVVLAIVAALVKMVIKIVTSPKDTVENTVDNDLIVSEEKENSEESL